MNNKFDKVEKNLPIQHSEISKLWIYEGSNEMEFTPFAGKYFNRAPKALEVDFIFLEKVVQINKSILSALEGNFTEYDVSKIYSEGDVVLNNDIFYVSLDDNSNSPLTNLALWYPFKLNLNQFFMKDKATGESYKVYIENGIIKADKV